ncbi:hypothetical protein NP233_g9452 [Leucocoprinus birnbaumii]|uniref:Uncharacterized protein n=1 Tax=Leucocoprinus birnbaumii TaxID=56174 RepID=A0AAD5VMQ0_9AGAR|nr:hypothetical protein NP233_g9452 [Leucocoprinus birnbaumii]
MLLTIRPPRFARDGVVRILDGMGIKLPSGTKLEPGALNQRLRKALDAAQRFYEVFPNSDVNPDEYPEWKFEKPVHLCFHMNRNPEDDSRDVSPERNIEGNELVEAGTGIPDFEDLQYEKSFKKMIYLIDDFSIHWDLKGYHGGNLDILLKDEETESAVFLRIVSIREIALGKPMMFLNFVAVDESEKPEDERTFMKMESSYGVGVYPVSTIELDLFLQLLFLNRKHISPNYRPPWESPTHLWNAASKHFNLSFFLPMAMPSDPDAVRLSKNSGCIICGENTTGVCDRCQNAQYCGKDINRMPAIGLENA